MALIKLSTGLRNFLLDFGSLRKAFENSVIKIYSGTAPVSPDDAATGDLLLVLSKASGAVSASEKGTQKITVVTVTAADTLTTVTLGGVAYTYNPGGAMTAINIAINLARVINETCPVCIAVPTGDAATLNVMSRTDGETFTSAATANCTISDKVAAVDSDCLSFEISATTGVLEKNADVWSGVGLKTGTAGYFRQVASEDTGVLSTTERRTQGLVAASGAAMTASNLQITLGATCTLDSAAITMPAS